MTGSPPALAIRSGSRWLASLSVRMMLLNALLAALSSALLVLLVSWLAVRLVTLGVDDAIASEMNIFEAEYRRDGIPGVRDHVNQRLSLPEDHHEYYLLVDRDGHRITGNLDHWPNGYRDVAGWMRLRVPDRDEPVQVRAMHTRFDDGSGLLIASDDRAVAAVRSSIGRAAGFGVALTLLVSLLVGYLSSKVPLRQIEAINRTAGFIIDGDLSRRMPVRGVDDEFDRLGRTLNTMLDRINELMQAVRSATDNIAHDLRTPLSRLKHRVDAARGEYAQRAVPVEILDCFGAEVDRVLTVFNSLLRLATIESGLLRQGFRRVELLPLLDDAVQFYEPVATERGIVLALPAAAARSVNGDRDLLFQAICNLLDNAIKFSPEGGAVSVDLLDAGRSLQIIVRDSGPGIPEAERERVFDRLVRLDASRNTPGSGLGLSLVRAVARLHHGEARVLAGDGGTRVALELPALP